MNDIKYIRSITEDEVQNYIKEIKLLWIEDIIKKYSLGYYESKGRKAYGIIYLVRNIKNGKCYVGKTTQTFSERYSNCFYNNTHVEEIKKDIEKYGRKSFRFKRKLDIGYSKEDLEELEKYYIWKYNCLEGYNRVK